MLLAETRGELSSPHMAFISYFVQRFVAAEFKHGYLVVTESQESSVVFVCILKDVHTLLLQLTKVYGPKYHVLLLIHAIISSITPKSHLEQSNEPL